MRYTEFTPFDLWLLAQGLGVTIGLFLVTSLIGLAIGTLWGVIRFYRVPLLTQVITFIAEILKNSPVLVQLFLVFFGFPALLKLNMTPVNAAIITLSLNTAAFVYVIAVSSIESIGRDQVEAARVFGLSRWQVLRHVITPQALAFSIGPLTALLVYHFWRNWRRGVYAMPPAPAPALVFTPGQGTTARRSRAIRGEPSVES